jgi:hypothetical protein
VRVAARRVVACRREARRRRAAVARFEVRNATSVLALRAGAIVFATETAFAVTMGFAIATVPAAARGSAAASVPR